MEITVCVHLIDEASSPGAGGLWRWAVHVGRDYGDKASCLNAGAADSESDALRIGQMVAVAAARVAERCGVLELSDHMSVVLDYDPCGDPWVLAKVEDY